MIRYILTFLLLCFLISCKKDDLDLDKSIFLFGNIANSETGTPIGGVVISDGYFSAITNEYGEYELNGHRDARHVFFSVPAEYEIPMQNGIPNFFKVIDASYDSLQFNFELTPLENGIENKFTFFSLADPQVRNMANVNRLKSETIEDLKNEAKEHEKVYGIILGDLVHDNIELFGEVKESFVDSDIPFFYAIGNHDFLPGANNSLHAIESFENHFGPVNYSFNRGGAHFVVMNNVIFNGEYSYKRGFTQEQIRWLRSNLQYVPKEKLLIICLHIPVIENENILMRNEFFEAIKHFNEVHIMSGHYHANNTIWNQQYGIFEHIIGAASGLWWNGTVNRDGAPNGYKVFQIEGNRISNWYYKSTNYEKSFQIKMYEPYTFGESEGYLIANIWNVDENWNVKLYENGIPRDVDRFSDFDPGSYEFKKSLGLIEPMYANAASWYLKTNNLFRYKPHNHNSTVLFEANDQFGNIYYQDRFVNSIEEIRRYGN